MNAYEIMAMVNKVLRREGKSKEEREKVIAEMQSSDYYHLVEIAKQYIKL